MYRESGGSSRKRPSRNGWLALASGEKTLLVSRLCDHKQKKNDGNPKYGSQINRGILILRVLHDSKLRHITLGSITEEQENELLWYTTHSKKLVPSSVMCSYDQTVGGSLHTPRRLLPLFSLKQTEEILRRIRAWCRPVLLL